MVPGTVQVNPKRPQMSASENIQVFLLRLKELGFEDYQLFEQSDLVDRKNMGNVLNCLTHIRNEIMGKNNLQFYI